MTTIAPTKQHIDDLLQQAIQAHQAALLEEAEELYLTILQSQPYHALANHNMGLLAGQVGQFAAGVPYLHKALSVNPDEGQFWLSYADGLLKAGELAQALEIINIAIGRGLDNEQSQTLRDRITHTIANTPTPQERQQVVALYQGGDLAGLEQASRALTARYPASDFAWSVLATALQSQGKDALEALQNTVALAPHDHEAHGNLGIAWQDHGDLAQAVASYRHALALQPEFVEAYGNLATALLALSDPAEAEQASKNALALRPDYVKALISLGDALQAQDRHEEAVTSYRQALDQQPGDAGIYLNLGNAQRSLQQWQDAIASYRAALRLAPGITGGHANLAAALRESGDFGAAADAYRQAIAAEPGNVELRHHLGQTLQAQGLADPAIVAYEQALLLNADFAPALSSLGLLQCQQKNYPAAIGYAQRALVLLPLDVQACSNLAIIYSHADECDEAVAYFERAIALGPDNADLHLQLTEYLQSIHRQQEAIAACQRALEHIPDHPGLINNLGRAHQALRQFEPALDAYQRARTLAPDNLAILCNIGNNYLDMGEFVKSREFFYEALKLNPELARAHFCLGSSYSAAKDTAGSIAHYRAAIKFDPQYREAYINLGAALNNMGRLDEALEVCRDGLAAGPEWEEVFSNYLFVMSHCATISAEELFAEHVRYGKTFEALAAPLRAAHHNSREPMRTLKVGLVSGDLHSHPVPHFLIPVLENISADADLSLYAYHNNSVDDVISARLRKLIPHWCHVEKLSDAALVAKIREDGIDILIDLSGHTGKNRLRVFAAKPAPVQASWIGYPLTTGLSTIDYYLSDSLLSSNGELETQFTEKLLLLPVVSPFVPTGFAPPICRAPALTNGYLTFGSFNRRNKINRQTVARWSKLLRAIPSARMLLAAMPASTPDPELAAWFEEEGIAAERLNYEPRSTIDKYMEMHHRVDICLDTFPYGGGTTTLHALWMGVPTLTIAGPTQPSRAGTVIMRQVELEEFVAVDEEEYVRKGLTMAANPMLLGAYRLSARHRLERSAFANTRLVAEGLENGLRMAWQRWCAGFPPTMFHVPVAVAHPPIGL